VQYQELFMKIDVTAKILKNYKLNISIPVMREANFEN